MHWLGEVSSGDKPSSIYLSLSYPPTSGPHFRAGQWKRGQREEREREREIQEASTACMFGWVRDFLQLPTPLLAHVLDWRAWGKTGKGGPGRR
jgi:hypothetical protein